MFRIYAIFLLTGIAIIDLYMPYIDLKKVEGNIQ